MKARKAKKAFPLLLFAFFFGLSLHTASAQTPIPDFANNVNQLANETTRDYFTVTVQLGSNDQSANPVDVIKTAYDANKKSAQVTVSVQSASVQLQNVLNLESSLKKPLKVVVKRASYQSDSSILLNKPLSIKGNTWLQIDPYVVIDGTNVSPMLTNITERVFNPYQIPGYQPYQGNSNIIIEGGKWNAHRDVKPGGDEGFTLGNASNILVKDVSILNISGGHGIDIAGVQNVVVLHSNFLGFVPSAANPTETFKEAIQLDHMGSSGPFGTNSNGYFDGSVTKNVAVIDSTFGDTDSPNTIPWQTGIGSHSIVADKPFDNVFIYENTFKGMGVAGIRGTNYSNVTIDNNNFSGTTKGVLFYSTNYAFDVSNHQVDTLTAKKPGVNKKISIQNNAFSGYDDFAVSLNSAGYNGSLNGSTSNVILSGNTYDKAEGTDMLYHKFAYDIRVDEPNYQVKGTVVSEADAKAQTEALKAEGTDAVYVKETHDELYRVSLPKRFSTLSDAQQAERSIYQTTGVHSFITKENTGLFYVRTNYLPNQSKAEKVKSSITAQTGYATYAYATGVSPQYTVIVRAFTNKNKALYQEKTLSERFEWVDSQIVNTHG